MALTSRPLLLDCCCSTPGDGTVAPGATPKTHFDVVAVDDDTAADVVAVDDDTAALSFAVLSFAASSV